MFLSLRIVVCCVGVSCLQQNLLSYPYYLQFFFLTIYILFTLELPMDIKSDYVLFTICIALLIDVLQEMGFFATNATSLSLFKPNVIPLVEHQSKFIFTLATLHELWLSFSLSMLSHELGNWVKPKNIA